MLFQLRSARVKLVALLTFAAVGSVAHADDTGDPITGKIRIAGSASTWSNSEVDGDTVPIELYEIKDVDHVGSSNTEVDGFDSADWSASFGTCTPSTRAVSITWQAKGMTSGTGACTVTATLYDKTDNAATDDAANKTLTITTNGWKLTGITPASRDLLYKGQGKVETFTATTDPATGVPADKITWAANGGTPATGTGLTFTWTQDASYVSSAVDDVITSCQATGAAATKKESKTTIVNIDKIQYKLNGTWTNVGGTLYVVKDTAVEFKALKKPAAAGWPSGKPVWAGSAGATGSGETKSVTFSALSATNSTYKTVTAECGDTSAPANVVVFDFDGKFTPDDNCQETAASPRSTSNYGVGEGVDLSFTTNPTGVSATQAGGLRWSLTGGPGTLSSAGTDGTARFVAGDIATTLTFRLKVESGLSKDKFKDYVKNVVEPSGVTYVYVAGSAYTHPPKPSYEASFDADVYLQPNNVSFKAVTFGESGDPAAPAAGLATTAGWFTSKWPAPPGYAVAAKDHGGCDGGDVAKGTHVSAAQVVRNTNNLDAMGAASTWAIGTLTINLPQRYRIGAGTWHEFTTIQFQATVDAAGLKKVSKATEGPY
jgi:hypothetical protein